MSKIPENIIKKALETPHLSSAVVSAHQESLLESIKAASEIDLIKPILIGMVSDTNIIVSCVISQKKISSGLLFSIIINYIFIYIIIFIIYFKMITYLL